MYPPDVPEVMSCDKAYVTDAVSAITARVTGQLGIACCNCRCSCLNPVYGSDWGQIVALVSLCRVSGVLSASSTPFTLSSRRGGGHLLFQVP